MSSGLPLSWGNMISPSYFNTVHKLTPYTWTFRIKVQNDVVTSVTFTSSSTPINFLVTDRDYPTPYIPQYDGSPATKKYVDDSIASSITAALEESY